jgi:hypothetical protein
MKDSIISQNITTRIKIVQFPTMTIIIISNIISLLNYSELISVWIDPSILQGYVLVIFILVAYETNSFLCIILGDIPETWEVFLLMFLYLFHINCIYSTPNLSLHFFYLSNLHTCHWLKEKLISAVSFRRKFFWVSNYSYKLKTHLSYLTCCLRVGRPEFYYRGEKVFLFPAAISKPDKPCTQPPFQYVREETFFWDRAARE